jgi:hypothetical protein
VVSARARARVAAGVRRSMRGSVGANRTGYEPRSLHSHSRTHVRHRAGWPMLARGGGT